MRSSRVISAETPDQRIRSREIYRGKSFSFLTDTVRFPDGREGKRDYVKYPEAVAVVPFLDERTVVLIRQYRYPIGRTIWEIPAGKLDRPGENLAAAAKRELLEETGYRAGRTRRLFSYYPCAGYSTEKIHIFRADRLTERGQNPDEDEFIRPEAVAFRQALEWVRSGRINDSKTIASLLYVAGFEAPERGLA